MNSAAKSTAALSQGKKVTLEIPAGNARATSAPQEPAPVDQWVKLLLEREADNRAAITDLATRLEHSMAEASARSAKIEAMHESLSKLIVRLSAGQDELLKMLAAPVVPEYDGKGRLLRACRVLS